MTSDPYIPPPAGQMWLVPTDAPVDDDLVRLGLDNAFPGLPEGLSLEHAERSIRAALAAALPLYERRLRQRIAEEIQHPLLTIATRDDATVVPAPYFDELVADLDAPDGPNGRTREAARRLRDVVRREEA